MKSITFIVFLLLLISCRNTTNSQQSKSGKDSIQNNIVVNKSSKHENKQIVSENCVIFLWPDSTELAKMQAENDEDSYNSIIDDMSWYPGVAMQVLDSFNIKTVSCNKEFIILKNAKNKETKLRRKEIEGDMILFRVDKEPIISNAIDFNRELTLTYFKK